MKQVWITGPGTIEVRDVAEPLVGAGQVMVETAFAGICGSDLGTLRRGHPWLPYPIAPGHEASGVVVEVGPGVSSDWVGARVYVRPAIACGECFLCGRGKPNLCEKLIGVGSHMPGAFGERFVVPEAAIWRLSDDVSLMSGALIEPLATAVHAAHLAHQPLRSVAIIGGGSIGLAMLLAARSFGAEEVVVVDPVESKRARAVELGADAAVAADDTMPQAIRDVLGHRPDVIFDCVASAQTLNAAVDLAAPGGTVVVVGVGHGPVEFAIEAIQDREVTIAGSAMYVPDDFTAAEKLVTSFDARALVTLTSAISDAPQAFQSALSGQQVKIHLTGPQAT